MGARVGIIGATGLVGEEVLRLLAERNFPIDELRVYASARSEGRALGGSQRSPCAAKLLVGEVAHEGLAATADA